MTPFEIAKQKRLQQEAEQKRKDEERKSNSYVRDEDTTEYMGLDKIPKAFRIIGLPYEIREKPSDSKLVLWSKWVHDSGKSWVNIYWPQNSEGEVDEEFVLWRLYKTITESEWIKYKDGEIPDKNRPRSTDKGYFTSKHEGKPSFVRVDKNQKEGSKQFGHTFPKKRIVFNVIDRMDSWCVQNKHSKILTSSHSPFPFVDEKTGEKKTYWFTDVGIPNELYKLIWSQVLEYRASWDLDLVVHKDDKKYIIRDAFEDKIPADIKKIISLDELSEEEKQYELYDLDKLHPSIGYYKVMNNFEKLFKQVDIDLGTKYFEELKHYYEEEKKNREAEKKASETTTHPSGEVPKENTSHERPRRSASAESSESTLESLAGWNNLDDIDKGVMKKYCTKVEGENFSWKEGTNLIPCSCSKKIPLPNEVLTCPVCPNKVQFD